MAKNKENPADEAEKGVTAPLPPGNESNPPEDTPATDTPAEGGENPAATGGDAAPLPENPPTPPGETVADKPTEANPPPQAGLFGSGGTVRARVICAGTFGAVDDVVEVAAELAAQSDELDAAPAAVAYAESLQHGLA